MKQTRRILATACSFALVAIGLMIWSLFDPRPIPVIVAMSIGQVLGTLSLLAFIYVVVADWRRTIALQGKVDPSGLLHQDSGGDTHAAPSN
jgi:hypothetical protein